MTHTQGNSGRAVGLVVARRAGGLHRPRLDSGTDNHAHGDRHHDGQHDDQGQRDDRADAAGADHARTIRDRARLRDGARMTKGGHRAVPALVVSVSLRPGG